MVTVLTMGGTDDETWKAKGGKGASERRELQGEVTAVIICIRSASS
jgi:hypothetical protein